MRSVIQHMTFVMLLLLSIALPSAAQRSRGCCSIRALVVDSATQKPLDMITVRLLSKGAVVRVALTGGDGAVGFSGVNPSAYSIAVAATGYAPKTLTVVFADTLNKNIDAGTIYLDTLIRTLRAVTVTAARPIIRREVDRISYDLQADPESKYRSVLEMMRKVPYLSVSADGNLLFKGNGSYKVFINGKPSGLMERNPSEILRSMPASTIQRIEVITTPPAKYDAEGLAGIINIVLVKRTDNGYSGVVNATERFPVGGPRLGLALTAKEDRLGVVGFAGGSLYDMPMTDYTTIRNTLGTDPTHLEQDGSKRSSSKTGYFGADISYAVDSLRLLYAEISINGTGNNGTTGQHSLLDDPGGILQEYRLTNAITGSGQGMDASLNYQLNFRNDKSKMLTFSYRYYTNKSDRANGITMSDELNYGIPDYNQTDETHASEHTLQADFVKSVHGLNIEAGVKGIFRLNRSNFQYLSYDSTSGRFVKDPTQSNLFTNTQDVFAAYNSYQYSSKKWDYKAGVRVEETVMDADFVSTATKVDQNYLNVIPSAVINRRFGQASSINLGFTQRIKRPGITRLNPFVDRSDPEFETTGNPDLRPVVLSDMQLGYGFSKKLSLNLSVDYSFGNNLDMPVSVYDPATRITRTTYENVGKARRLGFDYNVDFPITSKWRFTVNGNIASLKVDGQVGNGFVEVDRLTYYAAASTSYQFNGGWQVTANFDVTSRSPIDLQNTSNAFATSSLGINKLLFKGKVALSASVINPFTEYRHNITETVGPDFTGTGDVREYFRAFSFSANYRFGKNRLSIRKNKRQINNNDVSN